MKGLLVAALILVGAGSALHAARSFVCDSGAPWCETLDEVRQRGADLERIRRQRAVFAEAMEHVVADLASAKTTLSEAVHELESEAITHYPEYLSFLITVEHGETIEEKIAYNLVRHFHFQQWRMPSADGAARLERCRQQLRVLLGHELAGGLSLIPYTPVQAH